MAAMVIQATSECLLAAPRLMGLQLPTVQHNSHHDPPIWVHDKPQINTKLFDCALLCTALGPRCPQLSTVYCPDRSWWPADQVYEAAELGTWQAGAPLPPPAGTVHPCPLASFSAKGLRSSTDRTQGESFPLPLCRGGEVTTEALQHP